MEQIGGVIYKENALSPMISCKIELYIGYANTKGYFSMSVQSDWKYKNLKFQKVKMKSSACHNCDYFNDIHKTCILDESSVNEFFDTCSCYSHERFKIGDKVQVPYKGKIVDTEIVEIVGSGNMERYATKVGNNNFYKQTYFPKEIKLIG